MKNWKLCYIDKPWAFFTTNPLSKQWGDDWNDAPYEHNAGTPYEPGFYHYASGKSKKVNSDWNKDGTPKWEILKVAFDGWWATPCDNHLNSPYSVEDINAGSIAWLIGAHKKHHVPVVIPAGTSLKNFIKLVGDGGGKVYKTIRKQEAGE